MSRQFDFAPVRVGVAGLGRAGVFHIERIGLRDDCRVVAAYDDCPAVRDRVRLDSVVCHENWHDFLRNDEIELALIAAPPALHAEMTIAALAARKHVLVETPMCLNLVEADAVIAAAVRCGRSVSVAHLRRWDDDFRTARSTLATGDLGTAESIKLINWQYNPRRSNGHLQAVPGSAGNSARLPDLASDNWRDAAATGGGVLWEFGIHYFDQLLQLTDRTVESVYARLAPANSPANSALSGEDAFLAIISFSGGLVAHVEVSRTASAPLSTGWMITGAAGSYAGFTQYSPSPEGEVADLPLTAALVQADDFYGQLARHLRLGEPNPVPAAEARRSIFLIEAVRESARTGQVVSLCGQDSWR
ncbi:MAG TPA: Gfo/Idh/MocA family oxidoreductase [Planctomycetaceae bacterium]|jgi:predicted dehydrogenase